MKKSVQQSVFIRSFFSGFIAPSLPQPSTGQPEEICQTPAPEVESKTQARLSQDEHWPQQQRSPLVNWYLQSLVPTFVHGLPREAFLHSEKQMVCDG